MLRGAISEKFNIIKPGKKRYLRDAMAIVKRRRMCYLLLLAL